MRRATALLAAASALLLADVACAQGQDSGMRYLSWSDRPRTQPQPVAARPEGRADGLRRPNMVIPHGGFAQVESQPSRLTPAPGGRYDGLTPANTWLSRRGAMPAQPAAPQPAAPAPAPALRDEVAYAAPPPSQVEAPRELIPPGYPDYMPGRGYRQYVPGEVIMPVTPQGEPVYHGEGAPAPTQQQPRPSRPAAPQPQFQPQAMRAPQPEAPSQSAGPGTGANPDPMAPRRDAPIFRIQQAARTAMQEPAPPQTTPSPPVNTDAAADPNAPRRVAMVTNNTADRPGRDQGARYYSLHRQNGQRPDGIALPEPTYVDALAVNLAETPASQDLAAPDRGPTLIRDNQGRLRAAPAASEGDHQ